MEGQGTGDQFTERVGVKKAEWKSGGSGRQRERSVREKRKQREGQSGEKFRRDGRKSETEGRGIRRKEREGREI